MIICKLMIWLVFYSFVGWVYETILCSVKERKFVKRGFLNGPYCPIYGFGALLNILIIGWIYNPYILFLAGAIITCSLEYITSFILEKLFHARWWDYTHMKFNINGRVCLAGALVFGTLSVLLVKYLHPFVLSVTNTISNQNLIIISIILFVLILFDSIYTVAKLYGFDKKLRELHMALPAQTNTTKDIIEKARDEINQIKDTTLPKFNVKEVYSRLNGQEKRMIKSFSKFTSVRYKFDTNKIREYIKEEKEKLKK